MNELATIASRAAIQDLPFLVAGGHAVITHGFRRSTFDLDLIVRRSDREKWIGLAQELRYALYHEGPTFLQFNTAERESLALDMMLVSDETFSKLRAEAVGAPGVSGVWVVSLMHLLALKCHAVKHGHAGRIVKDAEDVIRLIQNNRLDPNAPAIREIFQKHGTEEFHEKVRKACERS